DRLLSDKKQRIVHSHAAADAQRNAADENPYQQQDDQPALLAHVVAGDEEDGIHNGSLVVGRSSLVAGRQWLVFRRCDNSAIANAWVVRARSEERSTTRDRSQPTANIQGLTTVSRQLQKHILQ